MTLPSGGGDVTAGLWWLFPGATGDVADGGVSGLPARLLDDVKAIMSGQLISGGGLDGIQSLAEDLYSGLRQGISLPLAIAEAIVNKLFGTNIEFTDMGTLIDAIEQIPGVSTIVAIIKQATGIDLETIFDGIDITDPGAVLAAIENAVVTAIQTIVDRIINGWLGTSSTGNPAEQLQLIFKSAAQTLSTVGNSAAQAYAIAAQTAAQLIQQVEGGALPIFTEAEQIGEAFAAAAGSLVGTAVSAEQAALGWIAGFFNAFTGQSATNVTAAQASAQAVALAQTTLATSIAVAQQQAAADGSANNGLFSDDDFERVAPSDINGAAGVGFWAKTSTATDAVGGYYAIADGHNARFVPGSGTGDQRIWFRRTNPADQHTQTLFQKVGLVVGTFIGDPAFFSASSSIRLRCRVDDAETQEVFCDVTPDGYAQFGYRNGGTTDHMINDPSTGGAVNIGALNAATTLYLIAGTLGGVRAFQLIKNGGVVLVWNDTGSVSAAVQGVNNGWGWGGFAATAGGASKHPGDVGIISIADNTPAAVLGSGLQVTREATGAVTVGSQQLPGNFFDTVEEATTDITWDTVNCQATISVTGWYELSFAVADTSNIGVNIWRTPVFYVGSGSGNSIKRRGNGIFGPISGTYSMTNERELGFSTSLYLPAGSVVAPGLIVGGSNATLVGDTAGSKSWFSIARQGS